MQEGGNAGQTQIKTHIDGEGQKSVGNYCIVLVFIKLYVMSSFPLKNQACENNLYNLKS